jgi:hypothetical protein
MRNFIKHFMSRDHRRSPRHVTPPLVTYYWDGDSARPEAQYILNISKNGLYLLTERRWYPGTLIRMTLQRTESTDAESDRTIAVLARAIWSDSDGVGFKFVFAAPENKQTAHGIDGNGLADKKALARFLQGLRESNDSKD